MISTGCIILAAGANERLKGLVPSFMKPLILVNGRPLIIHAIDHAKNFWNVALRNITIVTAPQNVGGLVQIAGDIPNYVVQPQPTGVLDAVCRGLPFVDQEWTLILMADNTFAGGNAQFHTEQYDGAIGVRTDIQSMRFTRLKKDNDGNWTVLPRSSHEPGGDAVWIGPLMLRTSLVKKSMGVCDTIEDLITVVTSKGRTLHAIPMQCSDLGVPQELEA